MTERLHERITWRESVLCKLPLNPIEKEFDLGWAQGKPMHLLVMARKVARSDLFVDAIEPLDLGQGFTDRGGCGRFGLKEAATGMRPALGVRRQSDLLSIPPVSRIAVANQDTIRGLS